MDATAVLHSLAAAAVTAYIEAQLATPSATASGASGGR